MPSIQQYWQLKEQVAELSSAVGTITGGGTGGATYSFANSNGVTFGQTGGTVTASVETNYQAPGAYLTTAALSNHAHADYQSTGPYLTTAALSNHVHSQYLTTAQPVGAYLTTAALSDHGHTQYLTTAQPVGAYLTTAMASNANSLFVAASAGLALTNLTGTLGSAGLSLSAAAAAGGGAGTNGAITGGSITVNTSGVSVALPAYLTTAQPVGAYLTTAALSVHTHSQYLTTAALSDHTHSQYQSTGAYLTTAALSGHSHGNPTLALTNISGTTASASNGLTLSLSAAAPGGGGAVSFSAGASSAALGSLVFSNGSGVSFGLNGSTLTASVNAGGGAAPNRRYIQIIDGERFTTCAALSNTLYTNRPLFQPFWMDGTGLVPNTVRFVISYAGSSNRSFGGTFLCGLYSAANSTQLTLLGSDSVSYSITASSQSSAYNGAAMMDFTRLSSVTCTAEGRYAVAFEVRPVSANATWMAASIYGADPMPAFSRILTNNTTAATGNTGVSAFLPFWGAYSATTAGLPDSVGINQINGGNSASLVDLYAILRMM